MHICFVVEGYPTTRDPFQTFVRNYISEISRQGVKCSVIAPQSITRALKHKLPLRPRHWQDQIEENCIVDIYQEWYFSFSNIVSSDELFIRAAQKSISRITEPIDIIFGHFWHMGYVGARIIDDIPIVVACGESEISICKKYKSDQIEPFINRVAGVVYVSTKSYQEAMALGLQRDFPYIIAPNGFDSRSFCQKAKAICREKLGWSQEKYIIIFVGSFNERKGSQRVAQAITNSSEQIYSCFIGAGDKTPECRNILFRGKVANDLVADYLSAADVFVLPTTNEGCCNAIIEAMACGLPIISSKDSFNDDILTEANSIRINPLSVDEIQAAIEKLSDISLREKMSEHSLSIVQGLTIEKRAERIIDFLLGIIS